MSIISFDGLYLRYLSAVAPYKYCITPFTMLNNPHEVRVSIISTVQLDKKLPEYEFTNRLIINR